MRDRIDVSAAATPSHERRMTMTAKPNEADEAASYAVYEGILAALQHYIDGAHKGDGKLMRKAFLETAHIRGSYDGKPVEWSLDEFCERIDKGGGAPNLKARVVSVDHSGNAAMARLDAENWRGTRYTDFFVLVVRDNVWRIASKVFFSHRRA
jgi:Putative lumazine-binding